jgi:GTP cyclohydrolase I
MPEINLEKIENITRELLTEIGEDSNREGLLRTPYRVAKSWKFLVNGYEKNLDTVINNAIFENECTEMVVVRDIEFYSLCEHHLLPFFGKAHIAYIPNGRVIGLSKIPRIVDMYSRRLQIQERVTHQIANTLQDVLNPLGVAVVLEGRHLCMQMRGVEKQNSFTTTSAMLGEFHDDAETRAEFLSIIGLKNRV